MTSENFNEVKFNFHEGRLLKRIIILSWNKDSFETVLKVLKENSSKPLKKA